MIITKSISRFARNTLDCLQYVRQLKELGIGIIFEKENIDTLDAKGEVLLTILSSLAQDESRSISENSTWGIRRRFEQGKVQVDHKKFLGYDKDEEGNLIINKKQAEIVKRIYSDYIAGKGPNRIAKVRSFNALVENKDHFIEKWKAEDGDELKRYKAREFIGIVGESTGIKEFDMDLYFRMVERMTVFGDEKVIVSFLDGTEVECMVE